MTPTDFSKQIEMQRTYFERGTSCFTEEHSAFAPKEGMFSVANQVAHAAHVIDWFRVGAFRPEGFDMNFEAIDNETRQVTSLAAARAEFKRATDKLVALLNSKTMEDLFVPIVPGPVMGGAPRLAIVGAIGDHSAHHRGALTVYARLLGLVSPMPYM